MADRFDAEATKLLMNFPDNYAPSSGAVINAVAAWGRAISEELNQFWVGTVAERDENIARLRHELARAERDWQEERQAVVELRKQLSGVNHG